MILMDFLQFQRRVPSLCVVADDSIFLTLLVAHLSQESRVMAFYPGLRDKGARYLQAVAGANGFTMDRVEVLERRSMGLSMHETHQKEVGTMSSLYIRSEINCFVSGTRRQGYYSKNAFKLKCTLSSCSSFSWVWGRHH